MQEQYKLINALKHDSNCLINLEEEQQFPSGNTQKVPTTMKLNSLNFWHTHGTNTEKPLPSLCKRCSKFQHIGFLSCSAPVTDSFTGLAFSFWHSPIYYLTGRTLLPCFCSGGQMGTCFPSGGQLSAPCTTN